MDALVGTRINRNPARRKDPIALEFCGCEECSDAFHDDHFRVGGFLADLGGDLVFR